MKIFGNHANRIAHSYQLDRGNIRAAWLVTAA